MAGRLNRALQPMNLAQRFMLATFLIMVAGMFGISNWVGQQIEAIGSFGELQVIAKEFFAFVHP